VGEVLVKVSGSGRLVGARAPRRPERGGHPAHGDPAGIRVGVERVAHVLEVRRLEVDADLLHAAVPVGEDELARRVVGPVVVARPRRQRAQHLLVAHLDGHLEQPQRIGLGLVVVGAPHEHRVDQRREPRHPQQVARRAATRRAPAR
jgi:hypothetical protein